ncbi:MAG: tetraacyldisaccharide 4'-kinase [Deltaproteobacteria bacterium RIFCSPHIGHO2_12_FULL_43_9]|nr:MAG: tetraacyldisaccharide 4'-kinase [Deltaproteobacteria bacterium RIFCSPHIGHO2_12_FULL_43_9]
MSKPSSVALYLHQSYNIPLNISSLIDLPLEAAALAYRPVTDFRNILFDHGILNIKKLKRPVISVGNMTVGGSGKTPLVHFLSNELNLRGLKSVVLSRGYRPGKPAIQKPCIVDPLNLEASNLYGDEAVLLARSSASKVIVCHNRYLSGRVGEDQLNPSLFILDDGFQHRSLFRDCDILVIDSSKDIEQRLFPRGVLREAWRGIRRADIIVLSKANLTTQKRLEKWKEFIAKFNKSAPVVEMNYGFTEPQKVTLGSLKGERVFVVAAIADPESLSRMLLNLGTNVVGHKLFRDHYMFTREDVVRCEEDSRRRKAHFIITTEKDGVRLRGIDKKMEWVELPLKTEIDANALFSTIQRKGIPCDLKLSEFST